MPPVAKLLSIFTKKIKPKGSHRRLSIPAYEMSPTINSIAQQLYDTINCQRCGYNINNKLPGVIPLSTDKWLTNNWPMTDQYCAISYQFFWLESLFLVILDCKSILVLLIYWFYEIFPSISIFNHVFILFFRCCCNKYVTGVRISDDDNTNINRTPAALMA